MWMYYEKNYEIAILQIKQERTRFWYFLYTAGLYTVENSRDRSKNENKRYKELALYFLLCISL